MDAGRDGHVHVLRRGAITPYTARVGDEGVERDIYSSADPNEAERHFEEYEDVLSELISKAPRASMMDRAAQFRRKTGALLLTQAHAMYARNPIHRPPQDDSDTEPFARYLRWTDPLFRLACLGWDDSHESDIECFARQLELPASVVEARFARDGDGRKVAFEVINRRWDWACLLPPSGETFLTSDSPARIYSYRGDFYWLWPLGPRSLFAAVTRDQMSLRRSRLSEAELGLVNGAIVASCYRKAYCSEPFDDDDVANIAALWSKHVPHEGELGEDVWRGAIVPQSSANRLGFIQPRLQV